MNIDITTNKLIVCGIATTLNRKNGLEKTIDSIINQVDKIIIYQNGYNEVFDFLKNEKIEVISSLNTGIDIGDAGKFFKISDYTDSYYFSIDDDIIYPYDYVTNTINNLKKYENKIIASYHGRILKKDAKSYYNDKIKVFEFSKKQEKDEFVHFGGTGVMAFDTKIIKLTFDLFKTKNMADIWVGKFAQDNNIPILCLKHNEDWLSKIDFNDDTIFKTYKKIDFGQDKIIEDFNKSIVLKINQTKNKLDGFITPTLSVIIPAYKCKDHIDECLTTVNNSSIKYNVEILVGIDGCLETLEHIKNKTYPKNFKFFYFKENKGPYTIKNTLVKISKSDNILFFDSDDIMNEIMIGQTIKYLNNYVCVKPKYVEFGIREDENKFGEGVFGIKKDVFLTMNGFEPWMMAADSDFMGRLYKTKTKITYTKDIQFRRRVHYNSLTNRKDTGMTSPLRAHYAKISRNKKGDGNPDKLYTRDFVLVDINTIVVDTKNIEYYNHRKSVLDKVLNPVPRKVVGQPIKKKDPVINDRTDVLYSTPKPIVRTIKPNKPDNRQDLINLKNNTNKSVQKQLFNTKPERRTGINPITIGGKSRT